MNTDLATPAPVKPPSDSEQVLGLVVEVNEAIAAERAAQRELVELIRLAHHNGELQRRALEA